MLSLYYFNIRLEKLVINKKEKRILAFYFNLKYTFAGENLETNAVLANEFSTLAQKIYEETGYRLNDDLLQNRIYDSVSSVLTLFANENVKIPSNKAWCAVVHNLFDSNTTYFEYYASLHEKGVISYDERLYSEKLMDFMYKAYLDESIGSGIDEIQVQKSYPSMRINKYHFEDLKIKFVFNTKKIDSNILKESLYESSCVQDKLSVICDVIDRDVKYAYYTGNGKLLGLEYKVSDEKRVTIGEYENLNHNDIFSIAFALYDYIYSLELFDNKGLSSSLTIGVEKIKENASTLKSIFKNIGITKNVSGSYKFKFINPEDTLVIVSHNLLEIKIALISFVFEKLRILLETKYTSKELARPYTIPEISSMSKDYTELFNVFMQGGSLDAVKLYEGFDDYNQNKVSNDEYLGYGYGSKKLAFKNMLLEELDESIVNKAKTENVVALSDGKLLFRETVLDEKEAAKTIAKNLKALEKVQDLKLKIIEIETFVFNKEGKFFGYITKPVECRRITKKYLNSISNKEVIGLAGNITDAIKDLPFYINYYNIYVDKDNGLYVNPCTIDLVDKNTKLKNVLREMMDNVELYGLEENWANQTIKEKVYFDVYMNSLDICCPKHNLYYNSDIAIMCDICSRTLEEISEFKYDNLEVVYEDSIAKHYYYNNEYNLKVYKKDAIDIDKLESIIDDCFRKRLVEESAYKQSEFLPRKKAIIINEGNQEFIGILYNKVDFKTIVDIKDKSKLNTLYTIKCLEKLTEQIEEIKDKNCLMNPFEKVVLSKAYKEEIQIVNVEFVEPLVNAKLNSSYEKYILNYIKDILLNCNEIKVKGVNFHSFQSVKSWIKRAKIEYTKYCSIHKIIYSNKNLCCPHCVDQSIINKTRGYVEYTNPEDYYDEDEEPENEGGEALIYRSKKDDTQLVKIFKENTDLEFKLKVILKVLARKRSFDFNNKKYKYVLPIRLLFNNATKEFFGYTMNEVEGYQLSILRDKSKIKEYDISVDEVFNILINAGEGIENLHNKANIFIGDLNGRNILFDEKCIAYFIDFDGMGIDEIQPEFCTDEYIDPKSKEANNITMKDDWFSFAIQAFHYLTYVHPFNGIYVEYGSNMDIIERMKKRISVVGHHTVVIPKIAKDWGWMNPALKNKFLNIFENEDRTSIVDELKEQIGIVRELPYNTEFFDENCFFIIDENAGIFNEKDYQVIKFRNSDGTIAECTKVYNSRGGSITADLYQNRKYLTCKVDGHIDIYRYENNMLEWMSNPCETVKCSMIYNDRLYFTCGSDSCIYVYDILENKYHNKIKFKEELDTKTFFVNSGFKFVIVKHHESADFIFCNDDLFHTIPLEDEKRKNAEYKILFDDSNSKYLVISDNGVGVVINPDGTKQLLNIETIRNETVILENISFFGENIYIPLKNKMGVYNLIADEYKEKETYKVNVFSAFKKSGKGFYIFTDNKLYDYTK